MDRWKAEVVRVKEEKRREEQQREDQRRERVRRKKMQVREKVGKSRNTLFFHWFEAPGGRKVGSLKRRVRSQLARWEMKNCTPLWREAHFQVKMYKSTPCSDHFWKLRCRKSARRCGAKHISKSKCTKAHHARTTFGSWDVEKVHAVVARTTFPSQNVQNTNFWKLRCLKSARRFVARSTFRSQNVQNIPCSDHFWKLRCRKSAHRCGAKHISKQNVKKHHMFAPLLDVQMSFRVAGERDCGPCQQWSKREGFVAFPKTIAGVGHLKRICKDAFSVAGAVQETCSSELLGGPGADFLRGVAFWSLWSSGLLRWFCVTGAALRMTWHHFVVAGAVIWTGGLEKSQNALVRGRPLCTQLSIFEGCLAELLRFWCCQLEKLKKSPRIASCLTLSSSKAEAVSQNSFFSSLQIDR